MGADLPAASNCNLLTIYDVNEVMSTMNSAPPSAEIEALSVLRTNSMTALVQTEIERMILGGELAAGRRINEKLLAEHLSVSRGPVREACRALAELGLVYLIPNRGVFVKQLEKADAIEVYDFRAGLVALAGLYLAPVVTANDLKQLRDRVALMESASRIGDFASFQEKNTEFHDYIVATCGNSRLLKTYRSLVKEFQLFRPHGATDQDALKASNVDHRTIVDALEDHDGKRCYDISFEHVVRGKERMLAALDLAVQALESSSQESM